jgi:hypothetical protein
MNTNTNLKFDLALYDSYRLNVELTDIVSDDQMTAYGFTVWRKNGYCLPKGMIGSYVARIHPDGVSVDFSIQSPTGDASDFHRYSFPCVSKEQAITMVDYWHAMVSEQARLENSKLKFNYLYS